MPIVGTFAGASARAYGLGAGGVLGPGDFESISTTTVGVGGAASITFSSIAQTYSHLQIRGLVQSNRSSYVVDLINMRFNTDTGSNYSWHRLRGGYTSTAAATCSNTAPDTGIQIADINSGVAVNVFSSFVIDILDYVNTNKFKTARSISGFDSNGTVGTGAYGGTTTLSSGNWRSTNAISTITLAPYDGTLFNQYSSFALYGVKA